MLIVGRILCNGYGCRVTNSNCTGHGYCETMGTCTCDEGYYGENCEKQSASKFVKSSLGKTFITFWVFFWIIITFLIAYLTCLLVVYLRNKVEGKQIILDHLGDCRSAFFCCFCKKKEKGWSPAVQNDEIIKNDNIGKEAEQIDKELKDQIISENEMIKLKDVPATVADPGPRRLNSIKDKAEVPTVHIQSINHEAELLKVSDLAEDNLRPNSKLPIPLNKPLPHQASPGNNRPKSKNGNQPRKSNQMEPKDVGITPGYKGKLHVR